MNIDLNHEMLKDEANGSCGDIWKLVLEYEIMIMHAIEIANCDYAKTKDECCYASDFATKIARNRINEILYDL